MDFKNITLYPDLIIDIVIYIVLAVLLCYFSKCLYEWKEKRRLAKEFAEYQQRKEDEES